MTPVELTRAVSGLLATATILTGGVFINFLVHNNGATIWGIPIKTESVHMVLGPALILINSVLVVFLWALTVVDVSPGELQEIRSTQVWRALGPLLNPFYAGQSVALNSLGYAFLIILWWVAMHSFVYSIEKNGAQPMLFGWRILFSFLFLAAGLASMLAIQSCWVKWGVEAYKWKWRLGFFGIGAGGFGIPLLFKLGIPEILRR